MATIRGEGDVRCNRIIHFRSKEIGDKTHPTIPGYTNINATSGNIRWKGLSPMKLGPFNLIEHRVTTPWYADGLHPGFAATEGGLQALSCTNLENIWQSSKVMNIDIDINKIIQPSFYQRRAKMAHDPKPHRRSIPKKQGYPICAYWDGYLLSYLDSRLVYCELYTSLVKETYEYQELLAMKANGIIGFDGQDLPIDNESMMVACLDATKPFGHELVLCCLLKGIRPWRDIWLR